MLDISCVTNSQTSFFVLNERNVIVLDPRD